MAKRIVLKIGTSTLTAGTKQLHIPAMLELVRQLAQLHRAGQEVLLVTSGAVAAGRARLANPALSKSVPVRQMLSAVGQPRLMALYDQLFGFYDCPIAQVLLTRHDLSRRSGYLNVRNTLAALLAQRIVPVINENDTVSTDEIRIGDNDNLAALVANVADADLLVLLTDQAGILYGRPAQRPASAVGAGNFGRCYSARNLGGGWRGERVRDWRYDDEVTSRPAGCACWGGHGHRQRKCPKHDFATGGR
jgi:glutamate 5-kinase